MIKDNLGDRMKHNYEEISKTKLVRRMPVIIRLDGCHFHTFTHGLNKPFDNILTQTMQTTMKYLCEHIQGCVLGYTQSDEITLVLIDYQNLNTSAWFDYEVQKMCSVAASMASYIFNKTFIELVIRVDQEYGKLWNPSTDHVKYIDALWKCLEAGAFFDARCFNIPKEEVTNCLLWRQKDAKRNSINSVAQAHFSHKELQGLSISSVLKKLQEEKGIVWETDVAPENQMGVFCEKQTWAADQHWTLKVWPELIGQNREYVERLINIGE